MDYGTTNYYTFYPSDIVLFDRLFRDIRQVASLVILGTQRNIVTDKIHITAK